MGNALHYREFNPDGINRKINSIGQAGQAGIRETRKRLKVKGEK